MLRKIISGGQVGADRGGLDWAVENGLEVGGWCPKGRIANDGVIPSKYPLRETSSSSYPSRTRKNIEEADATVIFTNLPMGRGSALTERICRELKKPYIAVTTDHTIMEATCRLLGLLRGYDVKVLNVAGSRDEAYYRWAKRILGHAWEALLRDDPKRFLKEHRTVLGIVEANKGQEIVRFKDETGMPCQVRNQTDGDGIWLGIAETGSILLNKESALKVAAFLRHWAETGRFTDN